MSNKELKIKGRVQNKHKTEEAWLLDVYPNGDITLEPRVDAFIPLDGELIIYDPEPDSGYPERRIKIGDGRTNVVTLPFYQGNSAELLTESKEIVGAINEVKDIINGLVKVTDLTGTTYKVKAGWAASAGYGSFSVTGNLTYRIAGNTVNHAINAIRLGYTVITPLVVDPLPALSYATLENYLVFNYGTGSYGNLDPQLEFTLEITGGEDVKNTKLIEWLDTYGKLIEGANQIDLSTYQTKTDESLETESKEIVGAINELNEKIGESVDTSNLQTKTDTNLVTANKGVVGAINEVYALGKGKGIKTWKMRAKPDFKGYAPYGFKFISNGEEFIGIDAQYGPVSDDSGDVLEIYYWRNTIPQRTITVYSDLEGGWCADEEYQTIITTEDISIDNRLGYLDRRDYSATLDMMSYLSTCNDDNSNVRVGGSGISWHNQGLIEDIDANEITSGFTTYQNVPIVAGENVAFEVDEENQVVKINYAPYSQGLAYRLNDNGESYSVTGIGSCTDTEIIIPAMYNGLPVTDIGPGPFYGKTINSIVIPKSVIGNQNGMYDAFYGCEGLTTIYCEAESQPDRWYPDWKPERATVVWGFANDFIAVNNKLGDISTVLNALITKS